MDELLRRMSAAYLTAVLQRAGLSGGVRVRDVTVMVAADVLVPRCFEARDADAIAPLHLALEDLTGTHALASEWPVPLPTHSAG